MTEMAIWSNPVADETLELGKLWECARGLARPDRFIVYSNLEDAAGARYQYQFAQLIFEGHEQLLRHPCGPKKPSTLRAVLDFQPRLPHRHDIKFSYAAQRVAKRQLARHMGCSAGGSEPLSAW